MVIEGLLGGGVPWDRGFREKAVMIVEGSVWRSSTVVGSKRLGMVVVVGWSRREKECTV